MNFDYIEAVMILGKDKPCLDYLDHEASYASGWEKFIYEGCNAVEIWFNHDAGKMKLKGSIPYFMAGQNFKSSHLDFKEGINHLSDVLEMDLPKAEIKAFEYGTTLEIPFSVKQVFLSHLKIQGMKTRAFDNGIYFEDRALRVKLYDAGKNLKDKLSKDDRARLSSDYGYSPFNNYLKIENHYKKPEVCFKKSLISLGELLKPKFKNTCDKDLITKYQSIMKAKTIELRNKKQLTSSTIPLIILKEYESLLPCKAEDLIKHKIKAIPSEILTKDDKKSRRRQIGYNMKKITSDSPCKYDVSELLIKQALSSES
jgi:hypothetical protein